jgi:hypothetical protein
MHGDICARKGFAKTVFNLLGDVPVLQEVMKHSCGRIASLLYRVDLQQQFYDASALHKALDTCAAREKVALQSTPRSANLQK